MKKSMKYLIVIIVLLIIAFSVAILYHTQGNKNEELLGSSCGTVTPGYNDECCQNKGYDIWNEEREECTFNPIQ